MDEIEIPADLSSLSVSDLQALLDKINEAGQTTAAAAKEAEGEERKELVATIQQLQEAKAKVAEALATAQEQEAEEQQAIDAAAAEFGDPDDEEGEEADDTEDDEEGDESTEESEEVEAEEQEAIAASGKPTKFSVPKRKANRSVPRGRELQDLFNPFTTIDGAPVESLSSFMDMLKRADRTADFNSDGIARVAKFRTSRDHAPEVSPRNTAFVNTAIMAKATPIEPDAIVAAGGFCGPGEVVTDIARCGRTDTPVRSLLGEFRARGKYQYSHQIGLDEVDQGIDYWTEADDLAVDRDDPDTWKPCYHLECQEFIEACPIGIPLCFCHGVFQQWSFPEQIAAALAKFDVALARRKERLTLQRLHEQSNQYTYVPPAGESLQNGLTRMVADLLSMAGFHNRNSTDGYVLALHESMVNQLLVDARLKAWVGPKLTRMDIIAGLEDTFQIRVVETPDVRINAPAPVPSIPAAPLPDGGLLPCQNNRKEVLLFRPEDFKGSSDDVDITVQTSIDQARRNEKCIFLETIDTVEKPGCGSSFSVLYDGIVANGAQPDLVEWDALYCPDPQPDPYAGEEPVGFPGTPICVTATP